MLETSGYIDVMDEEFDDFDDWEEDIKCPYCGSISIIEYEYQGSYDPKDWIDVEEEYLYDFTCTSCKKDF